MLDSIKIKKFLGLQRMGKFILKEVQWDRLQVAVVASFKSSKV
jgi:hypothetical protein